MWCFDTHKIVIPALQKKMVFFKVITAFKGLKLIKKFSLSRRYRKIILNKTKNKKMYLDYAASDRRFNIFQNIYSLFVHN